MNLRVLGNDRESMQFLPIESPHAIVVLGFSLLQENPLINWATGSILDWSPFCHVHCLKSALPAPGRLAVSLGEAPNLSTIPAEYQDLREVFSQACAISLWLYDCVIDLLLGHYTSTGVTLFPVWSGD
jgi:hypothetical protein